MKKNIAVSFLLLSIPSFGLPSADFGIGLNFSNTNSKNIGSTKFAHSKELSLMISNNFYLTNKLSISPGFSFEQSGEIAKSDSGNANFDIMYFRVPVYLKYLIKMNFVGIEPFGGIGVSRIISGASYFNENEIAEQPYFTDYGFDIEGGASIHLFTSDAISLFLSPMYSIGLNESMKNNGNSRLRNFKFRIGLASHNF